MAKTDKEEDEQNLQKAIYLSLQYSQESPDLKKRKLQREIAESDDDLKMTISELIENSKEKLRKNANFWMVGRGKEISVSTSLSEKDANQLFEMVFGENDAMVVLDMWSNQGIRFSSDPETHIGLVQHQGGPCGVLAPIQAFVLKYLLFDLDELDKSTLIISSQDSGPRISCHRECVTFHDIASITEDKKIRALVRAMLEILFSCGSKGRAVIATLSDLSDFADKGCGDEDQIIEKDLEGLKIKSASDLQLVLRVNTYTDQISAFHLLKEIIPVFRSRMGALLFLISALLSRGLDTVQADRDEANEPLVTHPFGQTTQDIVNLLLCGQAISNVDDDEAGLGDGFFLKGIPTSVEVGFLTVEECLGRCKVGQHLKHPKWPIWVIGGVSHYTVLFALDVRIQEENVLEDQQSKIKEVFDLYHFNGMAKPVRNDSKSTTPTTTGDQSFVLKPKLSKLTVSTSPGSIDQLPLGLVPAAPCENLPLVNCIRTRWPRAYCRWIGDPPSID